MCFWRPHSLPSQSGDAPPHKSQSSTRQDYRPNRSYARTLGPLSRLSASEVTFFGIWCGKHDFRHANDPMPIPSSEFDRRIRVGSLS